MEVKPHLAREEYGVECTECGAVTVIAFVESVQADRLWTECRACGDETQMRVVGLDQVAATDLLSLHLRQFISEETEESDVSQDDTVTELRSLAEDIESGSFN